MCCSYVCAEMCLCETLHHNSAVVLWGYVWPAGWRLSPGAPPADTSGCPSRPGCGRSWPGPRLSRGMPRSTGTHFLSTILNLRRSDCARPRLVSHSCRQTLSGRVHAVCRNPHAMTTEMASLKTCTCLNQGSLEWKSMPLHCHQAVWYARCCQCGVCGRQLSIFWHIIVSTTSQEQHIATMSESYAPRYL